MSSSSSPRPGTGHQTDPNNAALDHRTSISRSAYAIAKNLDAALNPLAAQAQDVGSAAGASLVNTTEAAKLTLGAAGGAGAGAGTGVNGSTSAAPAASAYDEKDKEKRRVKVAEENLRLRDLEAEVMGTVKKGVTSQSDIKERNLSQMISVLHMRLANLEKRQKERFELVKEDVRTDSTKCSSDIKSRYDEDDSAFLSRAGGGGGTDMGSTSTGTAGKKSTQGPGHHNNLVSHGEGITLDPSHLVFRAKAATETAKRLEASLEDAYGGANTRDFRGQKKGGTKSGAGGPTANRQSSQQKTDLRRSTRIRLEKLLQTNMESFVTRSILDPELNFVAPIDGNPANTIWPISVQWSRHDQRSENALNSDGECNPLMLLKYSMERIVIPAHEQLFRWLISQPSTQAYFVK